MDKNIEILLGSTKNINSVDVDNFETVELSIKPSLIHEYKVRNVLSAAEVFDTERNSTPIYRIYGSLEYLSMLNGLKANYNTVDDFFNPYSGETKHIFNSFDFYLVRPSTGYTETSFTGETNTNTKYILVDGFIKWIIDPVEDTVTPTNWTVTALNSYIRPEYDDTVVPVRPNGAIITLNQNGILTLQRNLLSIYGDLDIEFKASGENLDSETDELNVVLKHGTTTIISINTLVGGVGTKKYTINVPSNNSINSVEIRAAASNKVMYIDYIKISKTTTTEVGGKPWDGYLRNFEIIATPDDLEMFKIGFAKNVFNEQRYCFNFNKDIDISNYFDGLGFPVTELFLYARYVPKGTEEYKYTYFDENGGVTLLDMESQSTNLIYGDIIQHTIRDYTQTQLFEQIHYIYTPYVESSLIKKLAWKYNPLIPLRLQYLSNYVSKVNTGATVYNQAVSIPDYATKIDEVGNYVWREIQPQGYVDPLTGVGVDYPFVNQRRYLFSNINLTIVPDMEHENTKTVFDNLRIGSTLVNIKSIGDINDIGKPCK